MYRRFCLTLDLKDDPGLIAEYKRYHEHVWPEIVESIKDSGILDMEIYLLGTRMFMIMDVNESVSLEALMWNIQQAMPDAQPGESGCPWNAFSN